MMLSIARMVGVFLVGVPAVFANAAMAQDLAPDSSDPKIIQLNAVESNSEGVIVFRGSALRSDPERRTGASKVVPNSEIELVGGDTIWLVDRKAGVLTGCYLAATIYAGELREIRCERERLR